jgi:hydrogenase maturation protease
VTAAVIVGIGQLAAGDDGVGLAVARALAARGLPVRESADASILLALLEAGHRVVLVDAVAGGGPPGTVMQLDPDALVGGPTPLSSHGISVAEAIALARTLYGDAAVARLAIVGIAIERPATHAVGLSPAVAAAASAAATLVAELASCDDRSRPAGSSRVMPRASST